MKHHDTIRLLPIAILAALASPASGAPPVAQQAPASVSEQGLTVRVGETIGIMEPGETKCAYVAAKKLANGDLIVSMPWPRTGKPIRSVRSIACSPNQNSFLSIWLAGRSCLSRCSC